MQKPYQWLAWFSNIYPLYIYAFIVSNSLWTLIGILWKEKSLVVMNTGLTIIYVAGLVL